MPIPNQTLSILDPGLGLVEPATSIAVFLGTSEKGTVSSLYSFSSKQDVVTTLGQGPLSEAICYALGESGGPALAMRLTGSVAGTSSAVTKVAVGTSTGTITLAGAPFDRYEAIVEITKTGTVGVGEFKYSLDNGLTYSEVLLIPSGGTYAIPSTNITATFVPGAGAVFFEKGDKHTFTTVAPYYGTSDLAAAVTALLASTVAFDFLVLLGKPANAAGGATMFAALAAHMTTFETNYRYLRALMDAGNDTAANVMSSLAAQASTRIGPVFGDEVLVSGKPFAGFGAPKQSAVVSVAARAAKVLISTDLGRYATGPLPGVLSITHDERQTELLDQQKITTLRTYQHAQGFYITRGRLKGPAGSDFVLWQYGRIMDMACKTAYLAQLQFMLAGVRTNDDGTIFEADAVTIEATVKEKLEAVILQPANAEGRGSHVSAFRYSIGRSNNVNATGTIVASVAIRPLGYAQFITTTLGFATNLA